ncbi:hypothetical protein CAEBREN_32447 [Caenorhabditis brenneri]|uniref:MSP domain-containing protein n=1 Tax=Caenorhabditis brenneri TaxID=135651 RepID=G0P4B5_CAEBE|nr:hypothetical protein CAEBREN_32447 [Caenorhabditis brenneri]
MRILLVRTPIVVFKSKELPEMKLSYDVSVNNQISVEKSNILSEFISKDSSNGNKMRHLTMFFIHWSRTNKLLGGVYSDEKLEKKLKFNSYILHHMIIHFVQTAANVSLLNTSEKPENRVRTYNFDDIFHGYSGCLRELFSYYLHFDYENMGIFGSQVMEKSCVSRRHPIITEADERESRKGDTEVSRNGTVVNSIVPSASKVSDVTNENKQDVVQNEKSTMKQEEEKAKQDNGKSQQTEKNNEKKPMSNINHNFYYENSEFSVTVDPSGDLMFKMESKSQTRVTFKNISNEKVMFKIKVSDHSYKYFYYPRLHVLIGNCFSICPVFGILEIGESSDVVVTHTPSQCKEAKMVIVNSKYVGEVDLAKSFRNLKPTGGPISINLVAN